MLYLVFCNKFILSLLTRISCVARVCLNFFNNFLFIKNNIFDNCTEFLYLCPRQVNTKYKEIKTVFDVNIVYSPVYKNQQKCSSIVGGRFSP